LNATLILIELVGGIALLLWGVHMVRTGVSRALGSALREVLRRAAGNRFSAALAGLAITVPLQSSTATAIITGAFAERRLIGLTAALAVMLGADIGTAVAAQLLAVDLRFLSPIAIVVGVSLFNAGRSPKQRQIGRALIGVGLIMLALRLIVAASEPLREAPALEVVLAALQNDIIFTAAMAAVLTWLAHSSIAMILTVAGLVGAGVVPLAMAVPFVLGTNAGAAIAPFVATAGSSPAGRRPALGNLLMRGCGAVLALATLPWIAPLILAHLGSGAALVLNLHLAFNVALALVMLPLVGLLGRLVTWLLPERPAEGDERLRPRHLDPEDIASPTVALANASREALRLGDAVEVMLGRSIQAFAVDDPLLIKSISAEDDVVDALHEAIKLYLTRLGQEELAPEESQRCVEILTFTTNLEHIGDIIDRNLMELAEKKMKGNLHFSDEGRAEIEAFHGRILQNLQVALTVFMRGDIGLARQLIAEKTTVRDMEASAVENHLARVGRRLRASVETSSLHLDVIRDLKRIHSHIAATAYPILERAGELRKSRLKKPGKGDKDKQPSPAARSDVSGASPVEPQGQH
jgi:phosphate:Na+ symporter